MSAKRNSITGDCVLQLFFLLLLGVGEGSVLTEQIQDGELKGNSSLFFTEKKNLPAV